MINNSAPIARFRGLDLTVQRRLSGLLHGDHDGLGLGPGEEAEELARYQPGHDVRRIDQNVTARAREPFVWLTRARHELDTWLLLDQTASMSFGTSSAEKDDLAIRIAGSVGLLTDGPGNRLGIGRLTPSGLQWSRPLPSRRAAQLALRTESAARDGATAVSLAVAITQLTSRQRRPGLRIVVSDLIDPDGDFQRPYDWEGPLRRLAARNDVIMVELIDPRDLDIPDVGVLLLVDPESGRQREVDTTSARVRSAFGRAAHLHREQTAIAIAQTGADHLRVHTDADWVSTLARFVRARRRRPPRRRRVR